MKKTLLFILAAALCVSLAAQSKPPRDFTATGKALPATQFAYGGNDENVNFAPSERPSEFVPTPNSKGTYVNTIGNSYYFLVSNSNMRNTISWSPDEKTCAATWTMGSVKKVRGTGINYFDATKLYWGHLPGVEDPFDRIEDGPTTGPTAWAPGWGAHVFTEEGECIISHCTAAVDGKGAMVINRREKRGEGEWIQSLLQGPVLVGGTTAILWPTVTAVGNTIHMFCITNQDTLTPYPPSGHARHPLYYRSTDGGATWSAPNDFIGTIPDADFDRISGDGYTITARGNHVVILYNCPFGLRVCYLESTDGGDSWTRKVVYDCPFDWESVGVPVGPAINPTNSAVAIGDDGVVHVAFSGLMIYRKPDNQPGYYYPWYAHWSGIFTWNSNQPTLTLEDFDIQYDWDNEEIIDFGYYEKPFFIYAPGIGTEDFIFSDNWTVDMLVDNYTNKGFVEFPRLIAEGGKVYLSYSSVIAEPLLHHSNDRYVRGVFLTVSNDNGETFNQPENTFWLSYCAEYYYYDWTGFDPNNPMANPPEPVVVTENGYPTMSSSIQNNKIVLTWMNDMFQFPEWPDNSHSPDPWVASPFKVYSFIIDVNDINSSDQKWYMTKNIYYGDFPVVTKVTEQTLENLQIYPNPATDNVLVKLDTYVPFTVTVTNMMGQVVKTIQGQGEVNINVADYQSGVYIVNVKTASATTSQKLIVR